MAHRHHIVPRHASGSDDPSNLVELSVEDHALAHKKLWEEHGRWQDKLAWQGLSGMISREEVIRLSISNTHKGKVRSLEERMKQAESLRGKPTKGRNAKGVSKPETHKLAMRGKRPHVNQTGGMNNAAKKISTPHGTFDTTQEAAKYLSKDRGFVRYRLYSEKYSDWNFIGATS